MQKRKIGKEVRGKFWQNYAMKLCIQIDIVLLGQMYYLKVLAWLFSI